MAVRLHVVSMWTPLTEAELSALSTNLVLLWLDPSGVVHDDAWCAAITPGDALMLETVTDDAALDQRLPACPLCIPVRRGRLAPV